MTKRTAKKKVASPKQWKPGSTARPEPGMYLGVPANEYRRWPCINASTIKAGMTSMLAAKHAMDGQSESNASMAIGTILHSYVLEGVDTVIAYPGKVRRGVAYDEFCATHADKLIVSSKEMESCKAAAAQVASHAGASDLIGNAVPEVSLVWDDPLTGCRCKARVDGLGDGRWFDYKTTRSIDAGPFMRQAYSLGWHVQMAHYADGLQVLTGDDLFCYIVAQENKAPHDVRVFRIRNDILTAAKLRRDQVLAQIVAAMKSGCWPGIDDGMTDFELPEWAAENDVELDFSDDDPES